jgi:hemerythrin-like domain-containing protein
MTRDRREFLLTATATGLVALDWLGIPLRADAKAMKEKTSEVEISAPEDLMREHGVLDRILLIFEEGLRRFRAQQDVSSDVFHRSATLVRQFVENYHEKLEETYIFPRLESGHTLVDVVAVLRQQHQAGRRLTDTVLQLSDADHLANAESRTELVRACDAFIRMYRPHAAREDTVVFPALYRVASARQIKELGEQFENEEHRRFGEHGFEDTVERVAEIEKQLGIYDLASFTPT